MGGETSSPLQKILLSYRGRNCDDGTYEAHMAIAGVLVMGLRERMTEIRRQMEATPGITAIRATNDDGKWAAVLEAPSENMEAALSALKKMEGVLTVDLAFLSYEDDLTDRGTIICPPHKPRKKAG